MKKSLTGILAPAACLVCLTGCNLISKPAASYDVEGAKEYLTDMYRTNNVSTRTDYKVIDVLNYLDNEYTIVWSVDVAADVVKIVDGNNGQDTVDVNSNLKEDKPYVLTATIKAPDGTTATATFNRTVTKAPDQVPSPITSAPEEGVAYKLYMYQSTRNKDLYFTGKMSGHYMATTNETYNETWADGVDVYAIPVAGKDGYFNLKFEVANNNGGTNVQYIGVTNTFNNGSWHDNVILDSDMDSTNNEEGKPTDPTTYDFTFVAQHGTFVAYLDGVKSGSSESTTETKSETYWLGTTGTYLTIASNAIGDITKADAHVAKLVTMVAKDTVTDADKVTREKLALTITTAYAEEATVELPTEGTTYPDVAIEWAVVSGEGATITDNVLNVATPTVAGVVTVKATLTVGAKTAEKEFEIKLTPATTDPTAIIDAAYALAKGESMPGEQVLTGIIIDPGSYNAQYGNRDVTIAVAGRYDKPMLCYRLKGTGIEELAAGDTITVAGTITNYNGKIEFTSGCVIREFNSASSIVTAAYALENGATMANQMLQGVITSVDSVYSEQFGNITVTMQVGELSDNLIKCYRLKGTGVDQIKVGDTILVSGTLKNYNGTIEFDAGCVLEYFKLVAPEFDITAATAVATFDFGAADTSKAHTDGSEATTYTETNNDYTLTLASMTKVYSGAFDEKGNSCLKFGTSSKVGSFSFTVADDIDAVVIKVAKYKANATKVKVNGIEYTLTCNSNDGAYDEIVVDTTTNKTVSFETLTGACRAMMNSIVFMTM